MLDEQGSLSRSFATLQRPSSRRPAAQHLLTSPLPPPR